MANVTCRICATWGMWATMSRATLLALAALAGCSDRPGTHTSVVMIVADTLRADALLDPVWQSATPNLDRLAEDGLFFSQCFAHAPMTLPSHAALFSSRLPHQSGVLVNGQAVDAELPLLAEYLSERNFETRAAVSIATLWPSAPGAGLDRGFANFVNPPQEVAPGPALNAQLLPLLDGLSSDRNFFLLAHYSDPHQPWNAHGTEGHSARLTLDGAELATLPTSEATWWESELELTPGEHELLVASDAMFRLRRIRVDGPDAAPALLDETDLTPTLERSFLLTIPPGPPVRRTLRLWVHDAPRPDEIRARYAHEVRALDSAVGELLDALKERGLYEDTIILFTADHGEGLGEHGTIGHVQHLHRELLHVPLILKLPAGQALPAGLAQAKQTLVPQIDLVPTLIDLLGLPPLPGAVGRSLLEPGPRVLMAETHRPEAARDLFCLRDTECLMVFEPAADRFQVFDLLADPAETHDLGSAGLGLRPAWPQRLRRAAASPAFQERAPAILDAETEARLRALGY